MNSTPGKNPAIDTARARIHFTDGHVEHFPNQILAFEVWLGLRKGVRAAFPSANDSRPVYPWDYVF